MLIRKFYFALALTILAGAVACDRPQDASPTDEPDAAQQPTDQPDQSLMPQQQQVDPETMQQIQEIQQIQQQLEPIQQEALEDEALAAQLESLQARLTAAMRQENPEAMARLDSLQEEVMAAQSAGDQERMEALMVEGQGLQQEVQVIQAQVLQRPEISQSLDEFESAHRARMIEIDPDAGRLLDRFDELVASLPR